MVMKKKTKGWVGKKQLRISAEYSKNAGKQYDSMKRNAISHNRHACIAIVGQQKITNKKSNEKHNKNKQKTENGLDSHGSTNEGVQRKQQT